MASRKEQKEQARAARIAQEQSAAAKTQRTRRLQIFGGVTAIAVIVIVVAIVVSSGGGSSTPSGTTPTRTPGVVAAVSKELKGIPQNATTLGNPKAKVQMVYFGDLQCPICKEFTLEVLPQFIQDQIRGGKVKMTYRSLCTATCGPNYSQAKSEQIFNNQQVAAYAAGSQSKFWQYTELFYDEQQAEDTGYTTDTWLTGLAKQVPLLHLPTWQIDRTDPTLLDQVKADQSFAAKAGLNSTPSVIMKGPKGEELVDPNNLPTYDDLVKAVNQVS